MDTHDHDHDHESDGHGHGGSAAHGHSHGQANVDRALGASREGVRARWIGHRLQADVRLTVDRDLDVATAHEIADGVERALLAAVPVMEAAVIHVDPCSHEVSHV